LIASVIIPAHNKPHDLIRAVRSLKYQLEKLGNIEVVIVDDGSDPPLERFVEGELKDIDFSIVRNDKVLGRGAARNAGVKAARGEVIIFMDSDMTAHPEFVVQHLEAHSGEVSKAAIGHVIWTGLSSLHRYLETRGVKKLKEGQPIPWRYFDSSNSSLRKNQFERAGFFHEGIKSWGGEDTLLGYNLHREEVPLTYLKGAITYHHSSVDLDEVCSKNFSFGRDSLPVMISTYPEISRDLRVSYLMPPSKEEKGLVKRWGERLLVRGLLRFPGQNTVKSILSFSGRRISFICYDYLVYSSVLLGYRDFLNRIERGSAPDEKTVASS
jgi:glycosyltransferase involved in cell wall biosynthesis